MGCVNSNFNSKYNIYDPNIDEWLECDELDYEE